MFINLALCYNLVGCSPEILPKFVQRCLKKVILGCLLMIVVLPMLQSEAPEDVTFFLQSYIDSLQNCINPRSGK